ncbi:MAG: PLP-dependent transferase [Gammaproteobacteria bacterium]|nr:MAG: PLP-dependent transferase [Gammaproteobacteria bacterium]
MKDSTIAVREKIDFSKSNPISTPIFQASAFRSGDPNFYSRNTNPNFEELESVLAKLDNAEFSVTLSSGMAAIASVIHLLVPGNEILVCSLIYGCTYRFLNDYCNKMGITIVFDDITNHKKAIAKISKKTTMVFFETPTNPFLKTIDIKLITDTLKRINPNGLIVVDNTWATSMKQKPLDFGADIALYSGSKFFSGHSDVLIGAVTTNNAELYQVIKQYRFYHGAVPDAFSAWLTRRSLQTLEIRLNRHEESTKYIIDFLKKQNLVSNIYFPTIDGVQLKAYGCLLFFELNVERYDDVKVFMDALELFDQGTSMASVASAVANPFYGSHLSMTSEEKLTISLNEYVIRLSIGLEDPDDLISDLDAAFRKLAKEAGNENNS